MNLRSVFTVEQQRILQRYYENGMTNQSKNCFQLILQCAQETKLDFSVVRTWVGNKRRKMSSKSAVESGGTPPGTAPATPSAPPEAAVRNVVNIARSQSQQSSWTSSNNDVIVTGIYSPASSSGRPGAAKHMSTSMAELHKTSIPRLPGKSDADFQQQHIPLGRQVPHCKNASLLVGEKTIILSRQTSVLNSANSIYSHTKKGSSVQTAELVLPQKPMICHRPCKAEPLGCQRLHKPEHAALVSHVPPGPRAHPRDPACGTQNLEIREVFSLAVTDQPQRLVASTAQKHPHPSLEGSCLSIAMETGDVDDEYAREEELASMGAQIQSYSRYCEGSGSGRGDNQSTAGPGRSGGCGAQLGSAREVPDNLLYHSREFHLPARTSLHTTSSTIYNTASAARSTFSPHFTSSSQLRLSQNQNNYQISGNLTVPWITGCSRKRAQIPGNAEVPWIKKRNQKIPQILKGDLKEKKSHGDSRTCVLLCERPLDMNAQDKQIFFQSNSIFFILQLQDRTQFSDRDLATLKKYWDNGMTSLGSVCREKIEAVAAELNVDCEIVRTWIGNRRRKYRLMGIEVPPPRGGPADFSDQSEFVSKSALNPGEETATEVGDDNDRNDEVSICLSEGSSQEETNEALQNEEIGHKDDDQNPVSTDNVKIEILDDEESDLISNSEVDQMSSLLDYKTFTRSLILAIKSDDKEQQQALLSDLPPELEEMDFNHTSPEPDDTSFSLSSLSEKNASDSLDRTETPQEVQGSGDREAFALQCSQPREPARAGGACAGGQLLPALHCPGIGNAGFGKSKNCLREGFTGSSLALGRINLDSPEQLWLCSKVFLSRSGRQMSCDTQRIFQLHVLPRPVYYIFPHFYSGWFCGMLQVPAHGIDAPIPTWISLSKHFSHRYFSLEVCATDNETSWFFVKFLKIVLGFATVWTLIHGNIRGVFLKKPRWESGPEQTLYPEAGRALPGELFLVLDSLLVAKTLFPGVLPPFLSLQVPEQMSPKRFLECLALEAALHFNLSNPVSEERNVLVLSSLRGEAVCAAGLRQSAAGVRRDSNVHEGNSTEFLAQGQFTACSSPKLDVQPCPASPHQGLKGWNLAQTLPFLPQILPAQLGVSSEKSSLNSPITFLSLEYRGRVAGCTRGMEGMRHKEAEMRVLGFSQENFNKLKCFCAVSFCLICRFCEKYSSKILFRATRIKSMSGFSPYKLIYYLWSGFSEVEFCTELGAVCPRSSKMSLLKKPSTDPAQFT
ncbi:hypothetical protein IHE44_0003295 [Lamprotornis superbus]|uniref:Homeobox domain-containing protein n=1 Tax=Lamprotornis superbus TaxID=245042 RepID=A0A835NXV8_9PASS|nr:hypothetical protein IHE44_0003295 [Lamprotornis superbus]